MMKTKIFNIVLSLFFFLFILTKAWSQGNYKFHSHNDYEQELPFWEAYRQGAASIEADVFLRDNQLYVTHTEAEIDAESTLQKLYFDPIAELVKQGKLKEMQLLIDLKSEAISTLAKLIEVLSEYPELTGSKELSLVISGNRPVTAEYKNYPDFILFDHQNLNDLDKIDLSKIVLISQPFRRYSSWKGEGSFTAEEMKKIKQAVEKAHKAGKPFRFWGVPDTKTAWSMFAKIGVDYLNTDRPIEIAEFLKNLD